MERNCEVTRFGQVIVTADDANVHKGIDAAILELVGVGVVTNIAMFTNVDGDFEKDTCAQLGAGVGVHLNISYGTPSCNPEQVESLVNHNGCFFSPKDLIRENDGSLLDAIQRYKREIVPRFNAGELKLELLAQSTRLGSNSEHKHAFHSFHQDMDSVELIYSEINNCDEIANTRLHLLRSGKLSGFNYHLFREQDKHQQCVDVVEQMMKTAVKISALSGGIPYEVALHPADVTLGIEDFTAYSTQRKLEFDAWSSRRVRSLIGRGERMGAILKFPLDAFGIET